MENKSLLHRQTIGIGKPQNAALKAEARRRGVKVTELYRVAIAEFIDRLELKVPRQRKPAVKPANQQSMSLGDAA